MLMSVGNVGRQSSGIPVPGLSVSNPTLDYSFLGPSLPGGFTFTRSTTATYFNSSGVLTTAAIDAPRFDYSPLSLANQGLLIEEGRSNSIRNNTFIGAVPGTPGTPPTNMLVSNNVAATVTVVGTGVEDNISYVDYRFSGSASGAGVVGLVFETSSAIAANTGQSWSLSVFERLTAGSFTNITSHILGADELDGVGATVKVNSTVVGTLTGSALRTQRRFFPITLSGGGTTAAVVPYTRWNVTGAGALDFTVRIGMPQIEVGSTSTSVIPTTGSANSRGQDVCTLAHSIAGYPVSYYVEGMEPIIQVPIAGFFTIDDGTAANRLFLREQAGFNLYNAGSYNASVLQAPNPTIGSANAGSAWKMAIMFNTSAVRGSKGGGGVIGAAGGTAPAAGLLNTMRIGAGQPGGLYANGYIKRVQYWAGGLSDAQLIQAST